jgi:hypothetical protein
MPDREPDHLAPSDGVWAKAEKHRTPILVGLVCVALTVFAVKGCAPSAPAARRSCPGRPPRPPPIDPLVNLGQLSPTAAALVGPEFDARRELARRAVGGHDPKPVSTSARS